MGAAAADGPVSGSASLVLAPVARGVPRSLPATLAEDVIDQPARIQFEVFSTSTAARLTPAWMG